MTKLTFILLLLTLVSCTSSKKENEEVKNDSSQSIASQPSVDSDRLKLQNRSKELEKIGYNYSTKIVSGGKISFDDRELTYVQDLLDSSDHVRGKLYVELLNDSSFKRLYVLDGKEIKFLIGGNVMTNRIDSMFYDNSKNIPFQFDVRCKHYFVVYFGASDPMGIHYFDKHKEFNIWNP
jgi:hypothetical protein